MSPRISYVVPVYNNVGTIRRTWEQIRDLFASVVTDCDYEIVFVDDGSKDESFKEMQGVTAADPKVRQVRFTRNFGQVPAIIAGYMTASGAAVINISADLQDPIQLSADMIRRWQIGDDVVVGYRQAREDSLVPTIMSRLAYGALRLSNPGIPFGGFDYVLMSRKALDAFLSYKGRHRFFQGDILWAGFPTSFLPYTRRRREVGKSQYSFSKKLKLFFDFVLDGSYLPIRLMSLVGVMTAIIGAIYAIVITASWALGSTPFSGWAPIMVVNLLIGGIIMLMLGIVGEYLWRILDEIKSKPLFVIQSNRTTDNHNGQSTDN